MAWIGSAAIRARKAAWPMGRLRYWRASMAISRVSGRTTPPVELDAAGPRTARRVEAKTALAENYSRLGVEDVDTKGAHGARLDITGGGEPLALIVGLNNPKGHGSYRTEERRVGKACVRTRTSRR